MRTVAALFWAKVDRSGALADSCWEWRASRNPQGYGQFRVGSKRDASHRCALAHRVAWELINGSIPAGQCVLHRCDNPACVRPSHLFLGTRADNSADKVSKRRHRNGSLPGASNPNAKLTAAIVADMRAQAATGASGAELARHYGISKSAACRAIRGERWS